MGEGPLLPAEAGAEDASTADMGRKRRGDKTGAEPKLTDLHSYERV